MELKDLLEKQKKLDEFITKKYNPLMQQKDFLVYRLLALQAKRKREIEYIAVMRESFHRCAKQSRGSKVRVRGQI